MNRSDRIYIAGHRGLVGGSILRLLKKKGYENPIIRTHDELDLTRQEAVELFFNKVRPTYVFLAAAYVGGINANSRRPAAFIYNNLAIGQNVIHTAWRYRVKKLLNLGSSCIYPRLSPQPLREHYLLSGSLEPTNEAYAVAKIAIIKLCRYYNEQYGTNFISVMPTNLYGPGDDFNLESSHVLPAVIRRFHLAKLRKQHNLEGIHQDLKFWARNGEYTDSGSEQIYRMLDDCLIGEDKVYLWGTGKPYREFLFIDDLAEACLLLMEEYNYSDTGEIVNIGTGQDISIHDLAILVKERIGYEGSISFDNSKPDGAPRKLLDVTRIQKMGWRHKTGLKEGIDKTYSWYLDKVGQQKLDVYFKPDNAQIQQNEE